MRKSIPAANDFRNTNPKEDLEHLADFARLNPNPLMEFGADAKLTYCNPAALETATLCGKAHPREILPLNTATIVKTCLANGQSRSEVRTTFKGRTLSWCFFPIVARKAVQCYAQDITESLQLEAQLRQMQKMESVGQLAAGVAHDFNNVLTVIQGHSGLLLASKELDPLLAESARQISMAADRAAHLTRQLLAFSRKQVMQPQLLNLNEVLANVSKMLRTLLGASLSLECAPAEHLSAVYADVGMLEQVLINLAANARDAMSKGGTLRISTSPADIDETYVQEHPEARTGSFVCLRVSDTGTGMDAATLQRIFEPFFTTKEAGKGTGLGLSTVYGIIKQHRGWMEVQSQPGQGTTFQIFLPARSKAQLHTSFLHRSEIPGGKETILVVEDEAPLRKVVQEILQQKGYRTLEAATGAQALEIWKKHQQSIDLLLTDLVLPERMSGRDLAHTVRAANPRVKILYTSGYNPETVHPGFSPKEGLHFLQKPYPPETLAKVVRTCLDHN